MFGKVYGRYFLPDYLGIFHDNTPDTCTISELVETYQHWREMIGQLRHYKTVKLFTMFETSDVHPDIIREMKLFDEVIVPFSYLKEILQRNGIVRCTSLDYFTSQLLREKPIVIPKKVNPEKKIFLYVGTNDIRKNVKKLTKVFSEVTDGTDHLLIVKTNSSDGLTQCKNIKVITDKIDLKKLASLYNMCDYVISFTRGEGVGMPMVEGAYFGKPIIAHDQGVFRDIKKFINTEWITLPSDEAQIFHEEVPPFLRKVFYGSWWEVDEVKVKDVLIKKCLS
jgi:glycosyltransferase involved in cell wall biosynthesis